MAENEVPIVVQLQRKLDYRTELLGRLVHHMAVEGDNGDGIPEEAWDDWQSAEGTVETDKIQRAAVEEEKAKVAS